MASILFSASPWSLLAFSKASFWGTPCRGRGSHFFSFILFGACPGPGPKQQTQRRRPKADPTKQINPKQPGIIQGFPALFFGPFWALWPPSSSLLLPGPFLPSLRLAFGKPLAGDGASHPKLLLITSFWFVPFRPRHWLSGAAAKRQDKHMPLQGERAPRPKKTSKEEDPKQTQSRPINPKQPGITQGFPALFSQLAFFKASFWETPCRGRGSLYISAGLDGAPVSFHFSSSGLARGQAPRRPPKEEDPKQTQSRPINPKQPGITQGFPALFSQLAFFKASFWETPCRGRGSLYISAGLDGAPVSFHFSSSGLARGQAPRRPPKKKAQSRPKADQSTQSSLESPKAFRLYSLNLPSLRLPSGKPLAGDGAPYI